MFLSSNELTECTHAAFVGKLSKIETPYAFLKTKSGEIRVKYTDLHTYTQDIVLVTGNIQYDRTLKEHYLVEERVNILTSDFDEDAFEEVRLKMMDLPEVF